MKEIRFNQPKYIIPLILLPFSGFLFYLFGDAIKMNEETEVQVNDVEAINTEIPMPDLERRPLKDKFESFKEAFKYQRDFSAIKEIDPQSEAPDQMTNWDLQLVDSVSDDILKGERRDFLQQVQDQTGSYWPSPKKTEVRAKPTISEYDLQMKLFHDQMRYIDSISAEPDIQEMEQQEINKDTVKESPRTPEAVEVRKPGGSTSGAFNTIRSNVRQTFIQAIIDEDVKVMSGSRVRLRLLEDIEIGEETISKGNYLYALVTAFKPQRIELSITSILVEDRIVPVELKIYDNDGLPGLYVPASQFREFTRELASGAASGQNFQFSDTPDNQTEMLYSMAERAYSTATRSVSNSVRKNRARLKYNTRIYLVNEGDIN